ncbi:hypothetical protein [Portibacter lacus]|nr:hypothetical protein [Portibacter lacus]
MTTYRIHKNDRKWMLILTSFLFVFYVNGQRDLGIESIESQLDEMNLAFDMPTENAFKFSKLRKSEFFEYDTRIRARSNEMEVLIALHPDGKDSLTTLFPHLEFQRLLANLSPNDDEQNIMVVGWRAQKLKERNADWGAEAYFKPRKDISNFPYLKLIGFYREGQGMVVMAYCFDKPDMVPQLISFQEE